MLVPQSDHVTIGPELQAQLRAIGKAVRDTMRAVARTFWESMIAVHTPGDWPDQFVLLNRYVRTGVRRRAPLSSDENKEGFLRLLKVLQYAHDR